MIIFGSRTMNSTISSGSFNCPRCNSQQPYNMIGVNKWFTLYFIPVIPMGRAGEYVECTTCAGTFSEEALTYDPAAERAALFDSLRRILVMAMISANRTQSEHTRALREAYESMTETALTEEQALEDIRLAHSSGVDPTHFIQQSGASLSAEAKALVLQCVRNIYAPNRAVDAADRASLEKVAVALGFPTTQLDAVISDE